MLFYFGFFEKKKYSKIFLKKIKKVLTQDIKLC